MPEAAEATQPSPLLYRGITLSLLVLGYAGYYLCRSDLSVAMPLLITELSRSGLSEGAARIGMGAIASWGVLAYALGKFGAGWLADTVGGRRNFLGGMAGSVLFTILFSLAGGMPLFTIAWIGNRMVQSFGWAGIVKVTSKWFSFSSYGTVMGVISLSYLFGDAASRQFLSLLIANGTGWRGVFGAAAGTLAILFLANLLWLRESPLAWGFPEPEDAPDNLFGSTARHAPPPGARKLFGTLIGDPSFWLVCLLSLAATIIRETFNLWTPTYFTQALGFSSAAAAQKSALFPLAGGFSVILAGFLSDMLGKRGRAFIIFLGLLLSALALLWLSRLSPAESRVSAVWLTAAIAFLTIGPYSFFAGAISLDFGGKQGSATASGLIDGIGYLGGVLAGSAFAAASVAWGWKGAFGLLAATAFFAAGAGAAYYFGQTRKA